MASAARLDEYWFHLRMTDNELPGRKLLKLHRPPVSSGLALGASVTLSEGLSLYLEGKGQGKGKTFRRAAERACGYLIDAVGEKQLSEYDRPDALRYREFLVKKKKLAGPSVVRVLSTLNAIINFAVAEHALDIKNPFTGLHIDRQAGKGERLPVDINSLSSIQTLCRNADDEQRWLLALVSDTGMRLGEAAGLAREDIDLSGKIPVVHIRPHPWRRLKTAGSERSVPLVGASLWAAERVLAAETSSPFAFPRYNKTNETNANSASAALNKWLKVNGFEQFSVHSFRHGMRDRLRAVQCPSDIVDQVGGWSVASVGQSYGRGYPVEVLHEWLRKVGGPTI